MVCAERFLGFRPKKIVTCAECTCAYEKVSAQNEFLNHVAARNEHVTIDKSLEPTVLFIEVEI